MVTKTNRALTALALISIVTLSSRVFAFDGYNLSIGDGKADTSVLRVEAQWNWQKQWFVDGSWHLGGYWALGMGYWDSGKKGSGQDSLAELSITPVFRFEPNTPFSNGFQPYAEFAIAGPRLLSATSIGDRSFSTALQLGSHLGLGTRFGNGGKYELGYRYQHMSNGGIKRPNNGMEFHLINFGYHH